MQQQHPHFSFDRLTMQVVFLLLLTIPSVIEGRPGFFGLLGSNHHHNNGPPMVISYPAAPPPPPPFIPAGPPVVFVPQQQLMHESPMDPMPYMAAPLAPVAPRMAPVAAPMSYMAAPVAAPMPYMAAPVYVAARQAPQQQPVPSGYQPQQEEEEQPRVILIQQQQQSNQSPSTANDDSSCFSVTKNDPKTCGILYDQTACMIRDWDEPLMIKDGQSTPLALWTYGNTVESVSVRAGCFLELYADDKYSKNGVRLAATEGADMHTTLVDDHKAKHLANAVGSVRCYCKK